MMKRWKKGFVLVLALALCLCLTACGGSDDDISEDNIAGADWRTTGIVVGNGTITHDGESVDVLVTVSETSAAFYRDLPEQILFDSVLFPMSVPDAEQAYNAISFNDMDGDGESDVLVSFIHENGDITELLWLWDPVERYVFRGDLSTVTVDGEPVAVDNDGLHFPEEDAEPEEDDESDESSVPYFPRYGLELNGVVDMGTFLLENGACVFSGLGNDYRLADVYWEIVQNGDYTHDGIRELHFDAICYVPEGTVTGAQGESLVVSSELYDGYSGMWLTTATTYNSSPRGDNYYLHTVEWKGNSYLIEFSYSKDWQYNVGDWDMVLTKSYAVYLPEDYDGLFFAAETQPDNYPDCAKRMQMDSISPEATILDIDTLDPYSSLYFSLCF